MIKFEELLFNTPDCNDFRRLADGSWVAYSTKTFTNDDAVTEVIRATGTSIRDALERLHEKLK